MAIRTYADTDAGVDDLLQECWMHILKHLDQYEPSGSFAGWATAVSRNVCKMRLREKKGEGLTRIPFRADSRTHTDAGMPNVQAPQQPCWERVVHEALARLPDRERDVIVLRLLQGKTTAETAEILKASGDAVREILHRGMTRLKRMEELRGLLAEWKGWNWGFFGSFRPIGGQSVKK